MSATGNGGYPPAPKRRRKAKEVIGDHEQEGPEAVVISNVVATANLGVRLDLQRIAWECCGEFNPDSFAAASLRLKNPKTTALVFSSGRLVCTGATSEAAAVRAIYRYYQVIQKSNPKVMCLNIKIQNIVSTAFHGSPVDIPLMCKHFQLRMTYDPELFPGIRIPIEDPVPLKASVFLSGKCVIAGAKTRSEIAGGWRVLREQIRPFLKLGIDVPPLEHHRITAERDTSRVSDPTARIAGVLVDLTRKDIKSFF